MNKKNANKCSCGCCKDPEILTVTQLENQAVLNPENLENRDKILVLSRNINNVYIVKVMSTLTVKAMVEAINDTEVAFLLMEMKEPAAPVDPENPGATTPEEPGTSTGGDGTGTTEPENPGTEEPNEGEEGSGNDGV